MTLIVRPGFQFDDDASTYIEAVEAADAQALETATRYAINDFVIGCKSDGIWSAIKASCILAGARTLAGALVPLVGTAPTNNNFVSGDYNRKTGLLGNGSTKYLNSNRNNNADPQNSNHNSVYISTAGSASNSIYIGAGVNTNENGVTNLGVLTVGDMFFRNRNGSASSIAGGAASVGFAGTNRSGAANFTIRVAGNNTNPASTSQAPYDGNVFVFSTTNGIIPTNARLAFYSIGESLDLAALDNRISILIAQFAAVIP
jgi:hypothetical protein